MSRVVLSRRAALAGATSLFAGAAIRPARPAAVDGQIVPFHGPHQAGILTPAQAHTSFAAFDIAAERRAEVAEMLRRWTEAASRMSVGETTATLPLEEDSASSDSGDTVGLKPSRLTVTFGFGATLFVKDGADRFGLAARRPAALVDMPNFPGDQLVAARSDGDLSVQACADDPQVAMHAVRELARLAYGAAELRWLQNGFNGGYGAGETPRNLMGFKDGTNNPPVTDDALMREVVWVGDEGPAWMRGGSYVVYRRARIALEHWDRMKTGFQEQTFGRQKLSGVAMLAAAACSPSTGALGSPSTPAPTSNPSVAAPTSDATPPPTPASTGSIGPSPTPPATPPASASPTQSSTDATIVRAYFLGGSGTLVPVLRSVPQTAAVARAALNTLLAGPSAPEQAASSALYTAIPAGTRLLDISVQNAVATVDLSGEFGAGGGGASAYGRLAQLVFTLTQFPTVTAVQLKLDGAAATMYGGEGVVLSGPAKRTDYAAQLPAIFVDRPAWGAAAGNPATVQGYANVFEAQFVVQVRDSSGAVLASQSVTASCGTGCWGTFSTSVPYTVATAQWGTLRVYDPSAKDGSPQDVRIYPVWLTP